RRAGDEGEQDDREEHAGGRRREELLHGGLEHLLREPVVDTPRAPDHLTADEPRAHERRPAPELEIPAQVCRRIRDEDRLEPARGQRQDPGCRDRRRPVAAEDDAARHLRADGGDLCQRLVQVLHRRERGAHFAVQSTLYRNEVSSAAGNGARRRARARSRAHADVRGGRPYTARTLSPMSFQRADGGSISTSSASSVRYRGAWSGCGKSEAQKNLSLPTIGITPASERSSGSQEIQHWRRK